MDPQRKTTTQTLMGPRMEGSDPHGPSYGGVWGLNSLGFEGPRAVWSVWEGQNNTWSGSNLLQTLPNSFRTEKAKKRHVIEHIPGKQGTQLACLHTNLHNSLHYDQVGVTIVELTSGTLGTLRRPFDPRPTCRSSTFHGADFCSAWGSETPNSPPTQTRPTRIL